MSVNVRFAKSALADLQSIQSWYNKQGVPEMGARLVEEVVAHVEDLIDHPDLGRVVPEFGQSSLREIIHPPFRIVYRHDSNAVRIVRIWRSERRLQLTKH